MGVTAKLAARWLLGIAAICAGSGCSAKEAAVAASGAPGEAPPEDSFTTSVPADGVSAKKFAGRAIAATVRFTKGRLSDYDDHILVSDTKMLPERGGFQSNALATVDAGWLLRAGAFNGSTRGEGNMATSRAAITNAVLFGAQSEGLLKDVFTDDGQSGAMVFDLRDLLGGNGPGGDLVKQLFGDAGPLAGGIKVDMVEENARAFCDGKGQATGEATVKLVNLVIGGKPYALKTLPNQTLLALPGIRLVANAQEIHTEGTSATVDAAALHLELGDGLIDVKIARTMAGVTCAEHEPCACKR
jgi:hypothetical protein